MKLNILVRDTKGEYATLHKPNRHHTKFQCIVFENFKKLKKYTHWRKKLFNHGNALQFANFNRIEKERDKMLAITKYFFLRIRIRTLQFGNEILQILVCGYQFG